MWYNSRGGADDFYESPYTWPLCYLLGGGHLLALGQDQWDAITRQLTKFGLVHKEYGIGYEQLHQEDNY
jgi:hypothetical protein